MFRKFILAGAIASALVLGGCAGSVEKVKQVVAMASNTFTNPVGPVDIYRAKHVYLATLKLAANYREYCWSKPYAAILTDAVMKPLCETRRATVRTMQATNRNASAALRSAETFIRNNPSGNAVSYVTAAWKAVTDFRNAVPLVSQ